MKFFAYLLVIFVSACGGVETEKDNASCAGEPGNRVGQLQTVVNDCGNKLDFLNITGQAVLKLQKEEDGKFLRCGEHFFDETIDMVFVDDELCGLRITRFLHTYDDYYVGAIKLELDCPDGVCTDRIEAEFR
jgi:hypothetical protein